MKKYLLTFILSIIWFIGFSNADFTFVGYWEWFDSSYTPSDVIFSDLDLDSSKVSFECPNWNCFLWFMTDSTLCRLNYNNWTLTIDDFDTDGCTDMNWEYWVTSDSEFNVFSSLTVCPNGCSSDEWAWTWSTLLPNWESDLSWIISWLNSTITEFIPYLVYLGLWIITVIIWFVAIRWLVNRTQAKIRWTFSSWRRRK